jgi:hypothetical protein
MESSSDDPKRLPLRYAIVLWFIMALALWAVIVGLIVWLL